jgi:GNAT superfamily N-acetyltransferase
VARDEHLNQLRSHFGRSAVLWAGGGSVEVRPDGWLALSRASAVDYNVAAAYGSGEELQSLLDEVTEARVPTVVMLAGPALGEAQRLVEAGWVCIGDRAFMHLDLTAREPSSDHGSVRQLGAGELEAVRSLVAEVYELPPELGPVAIPDDAVSAPDRALWGSSDDNGRLMACLATVRVDDSLALWSVATAPSERRQGHGRGLVEAVLDDAAGAGATECLLHSSGDGEPLYYDLGFDELERWQLWSRPRWVLGRA